MLRKRNQRKTARFNAEIRGMRKIKRRIFEWLAKRTGGIFKLSKDTSKRIEEIIKMANEGLIRELLSVLDSFDISVNSLNVEGLTPTEKILFAA